MMLYDTHYHLSFVPEQLRKEMLEQLHAKHLALVSQSVTPSDFRNLKDMLDNDSLYESRLAVGFHPWWMESEAQVDAELAIFKEEINTTRYIGEIGLDYVSKRIEKAPIKLQLKAFQQLIETLVNSEPTSPYVVSIHAVHAVADVLDCIQQATEEQCIHPIFHRFNGTSDELTRLIKMGGSISVHPEMLKSKKGRAYIKQIPKERILLETDLPPKSHGYTTADAFVQDIEDTLHTLVNGISTIRGEEMGAIIAENQMTLLQLPKEK